MTMLASWLGVDNHGPTSAYIVSDSRFTWSNSHIYDNGRKVFASSQYPEIFGYAGDVLFPSVILSQIIEMIDCNILINENMRCEVKNSIIFEKICYSLTKYPDVLQNNPIQIMHITRDTRFTKYPAFHQYNLYWTKDQGIRTEEKQLPRQSGLLAVLGSGKDDFERNYELYQDGCNHNTSRNVFHCFIDTLTNTTDPNCGGPPQLVGVYRKPLTGGINYGIIHGKKRYFLGMEVPGDSSFDSVEWRNELFEICSGQTRHILDNAARQPLSLQIKSATP